MNITTEPTQEIWHDLQEPGAYEWWYFDAEDPSSGLSIVLIWFAGFPFSPYYTERYEQRNGRRGQPRPIDYSGFSFQLYENGRETLNFIKEGDASLFESRRDAVGVRFERNGFVYDSEADEYRLEIDFTFPARRRRVRGSLAFRTLRRIRYNRKDGNNNGQVPCHQWLLSVPRAEVTGRLEIACDDHGGACRHIDVRAAGYHDHNLGTMPVQEYISRWYWGRAFSERIDLIYYVIFFRNSTYRPLTLLMLHDNLKGTTTVRENAVFNESRFSRGLFAPLHGRALGLVDGDLAISVDQQRVLDAGPFYLRFSSAISLELDGERLEGIQGISEFLNPIRLQSKVMRFFTRSRIWRQGERSMMYRRYNAIKHGWDWFNG